MGIDLNDRQSLTSLYYSVADGKLKLFKNPVGDPPPAVDGFCRPYLYDKEASGAQGPKIFYVNGIQTGPNQHQQAALYLSWVVKRWVTGLYVQQRSAKSFKDAILGLLLNHQIPLNVRTEIFKRFIGKDAGKPPDLDKASEAAVSSMIADINVCLVEHEAQLSENQSAEVAKKLLWEDPAALRLYMELSTKYARRRVLIVAHSRGNLVVSLALWALGLIMGPQYLAMIDVYALASPAPAWPKGIYRRNFNATDDAVTWLSNPDLKSALSQIPQPILEKILTKKPLTKSEMVTVARVIPRSKGTSYQPGKRQAENPVSEFGGFEVGQEDLEHMLWNHCVLFYMSNPEFEKLIRDRL